jgi:general stress protein 26
MHRNRIWEILERSSVGMLTTHFDGGLRARPLDARLDREAGVIFFVIDVRGLKDDEVKACPDVCFTVIDADERAGCTEGPTVVLGHHRQRQTTR